MSLLDAKELVITIKCDDGTISETFTGTGHDWGTLCPKAYAVKAKYNKRIVVSFDGKVERDEETAKVNIKGSKLWCYYLGQLELDGKEYTVYSPTGFTMGAWARLEPIGGGKARFVYDPGSGLRKQAKITRA